MEYQEQGRAYEISGNFREAVKNYLKAALELDKTLDIEDPKTEIGDSLFRAAACFVEIQEYAKAIKCYQNAINSYSKGQLELKEKYEKIANCCADLATCLLNPKEGVPDYLNSIRFFQKAREFTIKRAEAEESVLQKYIYERATIYDSFIAIIDLLLELPESAEEIMSKTDELIKLNKISGFGLTIFNFINNILKTNIEEARKNLQIIEAESNNLSLSGPSFQAILISLFHNVLLKYVPEERLHLTKVTIEEKGIVYLSLKTFRNILLHTLFYANFDIKRSEWKETYGLLIGKIKEDDLIIVDSVPITSGEKFEVAFEEKHYLKAAEFDSIAIEKGYFTVGWYHSHPGLGLFLSPTDILNQLGYQNLNPKAIALVFDFTKISEEFLGFEIFRLDDPTLGTVSDFHKVSWKIKGIKKSFQKGIPSILDNFQSKVEKMIKKSPILTIEQIAHHLHYSQFVVKEILIEMFEKKDKLKGIFFDIDTGTFLHEESTYRAILNLIKRYKNVQFSLISKTLNVTEKFAVKLLDDMLNKGMIQGKIRLSSSDFLKD